jgi:hypothetical protein
LGTLQVMRPLRLQASLLPVLAELPAHRPATFQEHRQAKFPVRLPEEAGLEHPDWFQPADWPALRDSPAAVLELAPQERVRSAAPAVKKPVDSVRTR